MPSRQRHLGPHVTTQPTGHCAEIRIFPSATGTAWQAILATALAPRDRVLVLGSDGAARAWGQIAHQAGLRVELLETSTPKTIARRIGADRFGMLKAVLVVADHVDPHVVRAALDTAFHDALLLVDASTAPAPDLAGAHADIVLTDPRAGLARLAAE
ncbi:MAG: hypothetical protein ACMUJJ_04145 [Roseicyclus sp.]|uniref:hypothetical protein n=1 Tax=Roseicyclus sp. TaxID=1914329 RepID=UPI003A86EAD9